MQSGAALGIALAITAIILASIFTALLSVLGRSAHNRKKANFVPTVKNILFLTNATAKSELAHNMQGLHQNSDPMERQP
jgi:hypothetical protein